MSHPKPDDTRSLALFCFQQQLSRKTCEHFKRLLMRNKSRDAPEVRGQQWLLCLGMGDGEAHRDAETVGWQVGMGSGDWFRVEISSFVFLFFLIAFSPFHHLSFLQSTSLSILAEPCPCLYICEFAKHVVYSGASRMVAPKISLQELQTHHFNGFTALFRRCDKSQNFISSPAY